MPFTAPPSPPSLADPGNFNQRAESFIAWLCSTFYPELNAATPGDSAVGVAQALAGRAAGQGAALLGFSDSVAYDAGTTGAVLRGAVNVKAHPYAACGDGATDDTAALIAAEAAAYAAGRPLDLPPGTYLFSGSWSVRVPVIARGATIKQARPTVSGTNAAGVVVLGAAGLVVQGLTVDGNFKSSGITGTGLAGATIRDCNSKNVVNIGIGFWSCSDVTVWGGKSSGVKYYATGQIGAPADPYYFGGCVRSRWIGCVADDFRRIGFTADSDGATKSGQIQAIFCVANNAHDCDDSTSEYNAGFWAENTNSVDWLYCTGTNLAGNPGQTSGRVAGMVAFGEGNNSRGNSNVIGCRIFGGAGYLPNGIVATGSGTYADVVIADCYVGKSRSAVSTLCGLNSLRICRLSVEDIVTTSGSHGAVVVDGSTGALNVLEIDGPTITGATWHGDAGVVNFFVAPAACKYTLRNVKGNVPHVMRGAVGRIRVEESEISCGSASGFASFLAGYMEHIDCQLTSRNGVSSDYIINGSALPTGSEWVVRGGHINGFGAWQHEISGTNITTCMHGVKISGFCFQISTTGTFVNQWDACRFYGVPPAVGTIRTNFSVPTKQVLIAQGCYFESAAAADTPIRAWNTVPTNSILQNNTYRTAAALHNLGAVSSAVNNVGI